jgi:serine/threonine protein kinase
VPPETALAKHKSLCVGVQVRFIAAELSLALAFLHEKDIAYRDLKPENVMFDEEGHVRLIDFGLAKAQVSKTVHLRATAVGTPLYMTPEGVRNYQAQMVEMDRRGGASMTPVRIEEHEQVSVDADWYTLGTLMFELSTGHAPFEDPNQNTLLQKIKDLPVPALDLSSRGLSVACQECILALLEKNPSKRLGHRGHQDIRTHAFYAELDWQKLLDKELDPPFRPNARAADNIDQQFQKANIRQVATGDPSGFYSAPAAGQGTEYFPDWHYSRDFSGDEASKAAARQAMAAPSALATTIEEGVPPLEPEPEPEYPEPEPEPPPS